MNLTDFFLKSNRQNQRYAIAFLVPASLWIGRHNDKAVAPPYPQGTLARLGYALTRFACLICEIEPTPETSVIRSL